MVNGPMTVEEFKRFLSENRDKVNAVSPKKGTISKNDPWVKESEWDKLFEEVRAKNVQVQNR